MGVYIFTKKGAALKTVFPKNTEFLTGTGFKHNPEYEDISYLDVSGFSAAEIKTSIPRIKKSCKSTPWGIIDPKGSIKDSASLFFDGASDYLGPDFFKRSKPIESKRLKSASQWRAAFSGNAGETAKTKGEGAKKQLSPPSSALPKTGIKIPAATIFPGWNKMQTGKTMPFYLMYCALHGKTALNARLGDKAYGYLQQRTLTYLFQNFRDGDGIVWMESGKDFLFLLPPKIKNAETVIKSCVKTLASAPLVAMEVLGISLPVNFSFALHYGPICYSPPGSTGTLVSEAVNFIFHMGGKKAQPGRLTISGELPDGSVPKVLEDCFVSAGEFEGRKIWHTKKFSYIKPWF